MNNIVSDFTAKDMFRPYNRTVRDPGPGGFKRYETVNPWKQRLGSKFIGYGITGYVFGLFDQAMKAFQGELDSEMEMRGQVFLGTVVNIVASIAADYLEDALEKSPQLKKLGLPTRAVVVGLDITVVTFEKYITTSLYE